MREPESSLPSTVEPASYADLRQLLLGNTGGGELIELVAHNLAHLLGLSGQAARVHAEVAGIRVRTGERERAVGGTRFSRISWNRREDMPAPNALVSTLIA